MRCGILEALGTGSRCQEGRFRHAIGRQLKRAVISKKATAHIKVLGLFPSSFLSAVVAIDKREPGKDMDASRG